MKITGIKVNQWRADWDKVEWDAKQKRAEPEHNFYQFSIPASLLRAWSGVNSRVTSRKRGSEDFGIQRRHEPSRSAQIRQYVQYGYPWSELSEKKRQQEEYDNLRKPGWLPTAIVVNILGAKDSRHGKRVDQDDLMRIVKRSDGLVDLLFPKSFSKTGWQYSNLPPLEIIDGQHRLWAFDASSAHDFELPVVAFLGLDLSWQAYLFYTINIKPKKINPSLAFDLYPLLRTEDWLTKFEGHIVYRETRCQEIVDLLWSHKESPWHQRINMLGESGQRGKMVTQAAWVRALLATLVRSYDGPRVKLGGLFGSSVGSHGEVLPWSRFEQAAFLIFVGAHMRKSIKSSDEKWAKMLRAAATQRDLTDQDPAFFGENSLLSQDQGIRAFLHVVNDLFYLAHDQLMLDGVLGDTEYDDQDELETVSTALKGFRKHRAVDRFCSELCELLADFDWRSSSAPGLSEKERVPKTGFRGSSGYKELRGQLLKHLAGFQGQVGELAEKAVARLGL